MISKGVIKVTLNLLIQKSSNDYVPYVLTTFTEDILNGKLHFFAQ